jgi:DNA-binding CsgD family transcriptional regulator
LCPILNGLLALGFAFKSSRSYFSLHNFAAQGFCVSGFIIGAIMSGFVIQAYEKDFSEAVEEVFKVVQAWVVSEPETALALDHFQDCVYLKLSSHVIAATNLSYQSFFGRHEKIVGSVGAGFLDQVTMGVALKSDELLISSGRTVEFDHVALGPDGLSYHLKTHKRLLQQNRRGISILGITRILARVEKQLPATAERLASIAKKFDALDADDRALCCLMAAGHSQREMAEMLGCTTRTIENRRNRIMEELGASKPIEIVKLMVRMAEHGLIPADF